MVYTIIGHYLATGERLFEHIYVRTSSVDSGGRRVGVGRFDSRGLDVTAAGMALATALGRLVRSEVLNLEVLRACLS